MIRLTKKRLAELDRALSLDDVLYEKFRRLNEGLHKRAKRESNLHIEVLQQIDPTKRITRRLAIIDIQRAPNFIRIVVV